LNDTHTPISYGKMNKEKEVYDKKVSDYIDEIVNPIFAKKLGVPQEEISNSISTIKSPKKLFFRPNNWRLQIRVKTKNDKIIEKIRNTINLPMKLNINPRTKLISIQNYKENITIQYGKNTLSAIYSCPEFNGVKKGWTIIGDTIPQICTRIDEIKEIIKKRLNDTLKEFSRKFVLSLPFSKPIWGRHEDFLKGEEYIDNISKECQFIDSVCKKIYPVGIEMIGGKGEEPTLKVKTYLKNRAIEDIAPEIANSINGIGHSIEKLTNTLTPTIADLNVNMKAHLSAIKGIDKSFKRFNKLLSQKSLRKWL